MSEINECRVRGKMVLFKKSSFCEGGSCVEFGRVEGEIVLRNSNHPSGPTLRFTAAEWGDFLKGVRIGEFD